MLTESDIERERYEARLKTRLDLNSWERNARRRGEQIGAILAYERVLNRPQTPEEQLLAMPLEEVKRLAEDLEKQALARP